MVLYDINRVRDKDGKSTHAATVVTDQGQFHTDFFPCIFVGMMFEKETVMIGGKNMECYMPVNLGACENKRRYRAPKPKKKSEEPKDTGSDTANLETNVDDVITFNLERMRRETIFYYNVKDLLSYNDIVRLTYARNMGKYKDILEKYEQNPYTMLCEMTADGTYFSKFPQVARLQIPKTFDERLVEYRYGARYILHHMESSGDTWMPYGEFKREFLSLFKSIGRPMRYGSPRAILEHFDEFDIEDVAGDDAKVFRTETKMREIDVYNIVEQYRRSNSPYPAFSPVGMDGFEDEQKEAVLNSVTCKGRISIITGGPGVGKTTVLKKIVDTMREQYPDVNVRFLASTGKAANRIKESLGQGYDDITIKTVHKFLGWGAVYDSDKKDEIKESGLIIVDESSMMDLYIFSLLLNALDMQKTKVILVGDCDQLPSVECGNILSDMIALGVPTFYLKKNHRNNGAILENAQRIINGDPFLKEDDHFRIVDNAPSLGWMHAALCISDMEHKVDEETGEKVEIAAFSPFKTDKMDGNTGDINKMVQESLFKKDASGHKPISLWGYHIGDRVVFTRTDYNAGYFNGDIGIVTAWNRHFMVAVNGETKVVVNDSDIELAYSLTIHKSQGSEYDEVFIVIPTYTPFITRRMLYTAVTRARKKVTIFASREVIRKVVMNNSDRNRRTFLAVVAQKYRESLKK